jgi:hypothetical protein
MEYDHVTHHCTGGWVGPINMEKKTFLPLPGLELGSRNRTLMLLSRHVKACSLVGNMRTTNATTHVQKFMPTAGVM